MSFKKLLLLACVLVGCGGERITAPVTPTSAAPSDVGYHLVSITPRGTILGGGLYLSPAAHTWAVNLNDDAGTSDSGTYTVNGTVLRLTYQSGAVVSGTIVGDTITVQLRQGASVWSR